MAQTLMTPPEEQHSAGNEGAGYEPHLGVDPKLEGGNVFTSLWSNFRDALFPAKLPPLELQSKPIAVVDRMAVKRDPVSTSIAVVLHVVVILLLVWLTTHVIRTVNPPKAVTAVDLNAPPPLKIPPAQKAMGGGGGARGPAPVTQGRVPPSAPVQLSPPKAAVIHPLLPEPPTVMLQPNMQMKSTLPDLGMQNAPKVGVQSLGNCTGSNCNGIGGGNGSGVGPGSGMGTGGGVYQIGGGVSAPIPIYQPEPDYSEEARKAKYQGECLVNIIVDAQGRPTRVRVIRKLGMGLDEKAIEAVQKYKFKPAMKGGQPVAVELNVAVNFQIF